MTDRRQSPSEHLAAYSYLQLLMRLGVRKCQVFACTRCGGHHKLSQCPWPVLSR
jgi:hypothetical protein